MPQLPDPRIDTEPEMDWGLFAQAAASVIAVCALIYAVFRNRITELRVEERMLAKLEEHEKRIGTTKDHSVDVAELRLRVDHHKEQIDEIKETQKLMFKKFDEMRREIDEKLQIMIDVVRNFGKSQSEKTDD